MNNPDNSPKPDTVEQPAGEGLDVTTCCASSDTPTTDRIEYEQECGYEVGWEDHARSMERALRKFMAVTETSNEGLTQMATIEGRVKFYERLRTVRAETHEILSHNVTSVPSADENSPTKKSDV